MSTQAELIKDCMQRIKRFEWALEKEPESKEIRAMLEEEKELLEEIKKAN
jgi:hypothetical protein